LSLRGAQRRSNLNDLWQFWRLLRFARNDNVSIEFCVSPIMIYPGEDKYRVVECHK